jgi:hypothetical protein
MVVSSVERWVAQKVAKLAVWKGVRRAALKAENSVELWAER